MRASMAVCPQPAVSAAAWRTPASRPTMALADVAFVGIQYIGDGFRPNSVHACALHACLALQWLTQVRRLAGHLAAHGLFTRVHLWTPCVRAEDAASVFDANGPPVFVHNHPPRELEQAVRGLRRATRLQLTTRENAHWKGKGLFLLLKWAVVGLDDARLAIFLDLDMEVMTPRPRPSGCSPMSMSIHVPSMYPGCTPICAGDAARPRPSCGELRP